MSLTFNGKKQDGGAKRHRSPNYPTVGLRDAIDRVRQLYAKDGKAGAPAKLAAVHIGFGKPHGQAMSVLAALKRFGLVSETNGRIAPTQRAVEILNLPPSDQRCQKALREAALEPVIYRELVDQHRETGWPGDDVLASELVTYKNFNPKAVDGFVRDFKDSLVLAGLSEEGALESELEDSKMTEAGSAITDSSRASRSGRAGGTVPEEAFGRSVSTKNQPTSISTPVGKDEDGRPVFAHVRFDSELSKEFVAGLKKYLEYLETTLR